jgi:ABC-type transporter Mla subunit MlaD
VNYNSEPEGASRQKRHRFDRIEATVEAISSRVDSNAKAIEANSAAIAANREAIAEVDRTLSEAIGRTLRVVETLAQTVADSREEMEEYKRQNDAIQAAINASWERQDRILDYLMQRNGNN